VWPIISANTQAESALSIDDLSKGLIDPFEADQDGLLFCGDYAGVWGVHALAAFRPPKKHDIITK
jgi:sugar lactone lactonase YvrE